MQEEVTEGRFKNRVGENGSFPTLAVQFDTPEKDPEFYSKDVGWGQPEKEYELFRAFLVLKTELKREREKMVSLVEDLYAKLLVKVRDSEERVFDLLIKSHPEDRVSL